MVAMCLNKGGGKKKRGGETDSSAGNKSNTIDRPCKNWSFTSARLSNLISNDNGSSIPTPTVSRSVRQ